MGFLYNTLQGCTRPMPYVLLWYKNITNFSTKHKILIQRKYIIAIPCIVVKVKIRFVEFLSESNQFSQVNWIFRKLRYDEAYHISRDAKCCTLKSTANNMLQKVPWTSILPPPITFVATLLRKLHMWNSHQNNI